MKYTVWGHLVKLARDQRRATDKRWWDPVGIVQRFRGITDIGVSITGLVALFMLTLYLINIVQPGESGIHIWVSAFHCLGALTVLILVLIKQDNFPLWVAYLGVVTELVWFVYFVAFTTNHEQVVFRLQEFPLIALYLSWLFPGWLTRLSIYPTMLFTAIYGVYFGPAVGTEHSQTLLNIAALTFFTFLSISVGTLVRKRFEQGTEIDALTGALNRNGLSQRGEPALVRALRSSLPITVALIDLDGFKQINDSLGHEAGDQVLVNLVANWKQATRKSDLVCRLGGDEFVLLFPNTGLEDAQRLLDRTQSSSAYLWSYGLAQAIVGDNLSTMILRADRAMFENKRRRSESV